MGKILTYSEIEDKGGTIHRGAYSPGTGMLPVQYPGDNKCPDSYR